MSRINSMKRNTSNHPPLSRKMPPEERSVLCVAARISMCSSKKIVDPAFGLDRMHLRTTSPGAPGGTIGDGICNRSASQAEAEPAGVLSMPTSLKERAARHRRLAQLLTQPVVRKAILDAARDWARRADDEEIASERRRSSRKKSRASRGTDQRCRVFDRSRRIPRGPRRS